MYSRTAIMPSVSCHCARSISNLLLQIENTTPLFHYFRIINHHCIQTRISKLKNFIALLAAASLIGFVCFVLMFWLFNNDFKNSLITAISVVISSVIVEYLKPYLLKKRA